MRRLLVAVFLLALMAPGLYLLAAGQQRTPTSAATSALVIQHAKIYPSPDTPPLEDASILIRDGRIAAIGANITIPSDAKLLPCDHCVITAGFWNAHIHLTEPKWSNTAHDPSATLNAQLADMLTSHGFTTVVDTGSDLRTTIALRRRIETGELLGPAIYTAGSPEYPPNGIPFYLGSLPQEALSHLPQPATPAEAAADEERNIAAGADVLKLFTGSWVQRGKVLPMPVANANAAVEVAHRHHQLAFAHPSNLTGMQVAIDSGVDVLAHAADATNGIDDALIHTLVDKHMTMIPTLKMFGTTASSDPAYLLPIYSEVNKFHTFGGRLVFGTDVGYMTDYTTTDEFLALQKSGLNAQDILRMLTTAPSDLFSVASEKGTLATGKQADLVVLDADPASDITAFAKVHTTIRSGHILYNRP